MKKILHDRIYNKIKIIFATLFLLIISINNGVTQSCTQSSSASGDDCDNFTTSVTISCAPAGATITGIDITGSIGSWCTDWYEYDINLGGIWKNSYCDGTYSFSDLNGNVANGTVIYIRSWDNDAYCDGVTLNLSVTVYYTVAGPLPGENCTNAQDLAGLTSPYAATTVGYADDIAVCRSGYLDRIFYISVPNGSTIDIWESVNGYDEWEYMGYGGSCPGTTTINCWDNDVLAHNTWTNATGSTQTVWYVQDAYSSSGTFTLNWTLTGGCTTPSTPITLTGTPTGQTTANLTWAAGAPAGSPTVTYYWVVGTTSSCTYGGGGGAVDWNTTTGTATTTSALACGTTYYLRVYAYTNCNGTSSAYGTSASFVTSACGMANDECAGAIALAVGGTCSYSGYTNAGATASAGVPAPGCANYLGGDVWFSAVVPANGHLIIDTQTGVITDAGMAIYSGACGALTLIECDDDDSPNGNMSMIDRTGLTPGATIYIRIWEYGNDGNGTFSICVYSPVVPVIDDCPGTTLTPGATCSWTAGTTAGATETMTGCTGNANDDVWYNFVATQVNHVIDVDGNGDFDAVVELFSGNCGTLISITCMDLGFDGDLESIDATGLTLGNTYYIRVYHYYTAAPANSTFNICVYNYADVCGDFICGPTETCVTCPGDCGSCPEPIGGPYIHGYEGLQNTYVANCMVNTCSGFYYDAGGAADNYFNTDPVLLGGLYRTFCPTAVNQCVRATITAMDIENSAGGCYDYLAVRNGSTQGSPIIWAGCRTLATRNTIAGAWVNPLIATSTNGCLSFEFFSDDINVRPGFAITLSCVACATTPDNNDCETSTPICGGTSFVGNSDGPGLSSTCSGCVLSENYTNWYHFEITSSGRLSLTLDPTVDADDYDFALYKAPDCASLGSPVRCSYAENTGNTGMDATYSDFSEDVLGDAWVDALNVTAGESYYLMINKWSAGGSGFNLIWNLTEGGAMDCTILPIELLSFDAYKKDKNVKIDWATASEINNDYFTVLKSYDANIYKPVVKVQGAGNSNTPVSYSVIDNESLNQVTYYQLKQTDFDGKYSFSEVKVVTPDASGTLNTLNVYNDNFNQQVQVSFNGIPGMYYDYNIFDITGRSIKSGKITVSESAKGYYSINTNEIAAGLYSIMINDNETAIKQKLIITK